MSIPAADGANGVGTEADDLLGTGGVDGDRLDPGGPDVEAEQQRPGAAQYSIPFSALIPWS